MVAVKFISQLLSWTGIVMVLLRGYPGRRHVVAAASIAGFALGLAGGGILLRAFSGEFPFGIIKTAVGGSFIILWVVSVATLYRSTGRGNVHPWEGRFIAAPLTAGACSLLSSILLGAVCACSIPPGDSSIVAYVLLALSGAAIVFAAYALEKLLPPEITVSQAGLAAAVASLLLFSCSTMLRLDLFSPLTMKVMKLTHDFVHQFFESMLIPDHFFFNSFTWNFIGFFFSKEVGFWGGGIVWFTPVVLLLLAVSFEQLPTVAHIRQGAQRRKLLAAAIRARRFRLLIPLIALVILAVAIYRSRFPSVEYWDPKPLPVTADPAGEIFIPKKGEVDLETASCTNIFTRKGRGKRGSSCC